VVDLKTTYLYYIVDKIYIIKRELTIFFTLDKSHRYKYNLTFNNNVTISIRKNSFKCNEIRREEH